MADEIPGPSGAARHQSTRRSIFGRIYAFFDTKVGLAILTFLLTGGLGTFVTWIVTDLQQGREAETLSLQARANELSSLHAGIIQSIIEREIAADNLMKAFQVGASRGDVSTLWKKYEDAAHAEYLLALQSHLVITGHTEDGPDPGRIAGKTWIFWSYLTGVIQPRLSSMHDCLLNMHDAYVSAENPLPNRLAKARANLAACRTDSHWDHFAYTYTGPTRGSVKATPITQSVSDWDDFKICLEDYAYLLDMSARLEARVGRAAWSWNFSRLTWWKQGCREDNALCQQDYFFSQLQANLAKSCGNIDKGYE
jgi:hypothetical protein